MEGAGGGHIDSILTIVTASCLSPGIFGRPEPLDRGPAHERRRRCGLVPLLELFLGGREDLERGREGGREGGKERVKEGRREGGKEGGGREGEWE